MCVCVCVCVHACECECDRVSECVHTHTHTHTHTGMCVVKVGEGQDFLCVDKSMPALNMFLCVCVCVYTIYEDVPSISTTKRSHTIMY